MKINIIGKDIKLTEGLKEAVERKLSRLEKYFKPEVEAHVTLSVVKNTHTVEVTIPFNGVFLRAEESNDDMYAAIDLVLDKLDRQIRKQKTKMEKRIKGNSMNYNNIVEDSYEDDIEPRIVKTKRFAVKPMSTEEAVLQMELIGHNFFVFLDAETEQVNVVYKRRDNNYGLIESEF